MSAKTIRIGGASGFWGDAAMATPQLLMAENLDYIVYDYLAEITMSIMARARLAKPDMGYATDFVSLALKPNLLEIARQKVKILSNAGGINPEACAAKVRELIKDLALDLKVAVVSGDDLIDRKEQIAQQDFREMFSDQSFPESERIISINAYLGAFPIAKALNDGADIVITGRGVDSAVTLGACIHAFGWQKNDLDQLAAGSLAGHILECGVQATGGNFTDWEQVIDRLEDIGYPIAEISPDGSALFSKPKGTGGIVNVGTISEQMLYEIGDPQAYIVPDVVCDFSQTQITQQAPDQVHISGAKGRPPPDSYKVSATYVDGFRGGLTMSFYGINASLKAEKFAAAVYRRARQTLRRLNMADFTETSVEVIGAESQFGAAKRIKTAREVVVKIAAKHEDEKALAILFKEVTGLGLATPPGLSGFAGGRPRPMPVARLFSFLIPKEELRVEINMNGSSQSFADHAGQKFDPSQIARPPSPAKNQETSTVQVPLVALAWGRSGDKGNKANIGIIARKPEYFPYIFQSLTEEKVAERFAHFLESSPSQKQDQIDKFILPGPNAINFLLHNVLGGGGTASLRNDPQGKGYAQLLLECPIEVPQSLAEQDHLPLCA